MQAAPAIRPAAIVPLLVRGGTALWLLFLLVLQAPIAARLFLAGPLLFVPLLLLALPERRLAGPVTTRTLAAWAFLSAGPLTVSLSLPPGPPAVALAGAWIAVTGLAGLAALRHGILELPSLWRPRRAGDLASDAALGFLAIGGLFLLADRLGVAVMGYGAPYALMGAIHYTFLGFGLLGMIALLAGHRPRTRHWLAALGLVGGMTVTAVGLTIGSTLVNWLGVLVLVGLGGCAVLAALARAARAAGDLRGWALAGAAVSLALGMAMGLAWATASQLGLAFVGLETMVRTHGVLNALGVIAGTLALGLPAAGQERGP